MQEERIDWMETLMKGSSEYLQILAKPASLIRSDQYDPYSMAEPDGNQQPDLTPPPPQQQPLNYMEPAPSGRGWQNRAPTQSLPAGGTSLVAMEPQSQIFQSQNGQKQGGQAIGTQSDCTRQVLSPSNTKDTQLIPPNPAHPHTNPRHSTNRSTFAHSEREHKILSLSRANTTIPDRHLYEMDTANHLHRQSNPPPLPESSPPKAKPRQPPPRKKVPGSPQSKTLSASADSSFVSPEGEPRYSARPKNRSYSATKEPEYDLQSHPVPKERTKPMSTLPAQMSPSASKPKIIPRKKPQKQADYMELLQDDGYELLDDMINDSPNSQPKLAPVNQEIVQNFTSKQLDMLIGMLQQVQSDGKQQVATTTASTAQQDASQGLSDTLDHSRVKFGKCLSHST